MPKARPTLAKLTGPRVHNAVARERLFRLLDNARCAPLVWVAGPPGAGKTTLIASYLEASDTPVWWYQVDEGDRDPASLFYYLIELAKQHNPKKKLRLPLFTSVYAADLAGFTRRFFQDFFARLANSSVLVMDNCQDAAGEYFEFILREASRHVPQGIGLIAISRHEPPSVFSRLVAHGELQLLSWEQLRLTERESSAIAQRAGIDDRARAARFHRLADGWAAGLTLMLARAGVRSEAIAADAQSRESLFEYFANEIFLREKAEVQDLLLRTALFPSVSASMAISITGDENAGEHLEALHRKQYFIDRKSGIESTYQFHDLFRDYLLAQLPLRFDQHELKALRAEAASILERVGLVSEALHCLQQAQRWDGAAKLVRERAFALYEQGRWQTLNDWLKPFPEVIVQADPWLCHWRGVGLTLSDPRSAREHFEIAYASFTEANDEAGTYYSMLMLADSVFWLGDALSTYERWFTRFEAVLARNRVFADRSLGLVVWSTYLVMALHWRGGGRFVDDAVTWLSERLLTGELGSDDILNAGDLVLHHSISTANPDVGARIHSILKVAVEQETISTMREVFALGWMGRWCLMRGEFAEAAAELVRAADIGRLCHSSSVEQIHAAWAIVALTIGGSRSRARDLFRTLQGRWGTTTPYTVMSARVAEAALIAADGDFITAAKLQREACEVSESMGLYWVSLFHRVLLAIRLIDAHLLRDATDVIERIRATIKDSICTCFDAVLDQCAAEIALRNADVESATIFLCSALAHARNEIKAGTLRFASSWLPRQFAFALHAQIEVGLTRGLIKRWNIPANSPANIDWPWQLKISTLGRFEILIEDAQPKFSRKPPARLLALLKALIVFGGRDVAEQKLIDALWPDEDGDAAAKSVNVAITRLRKLLGGTETIEVADGKISLNRDLVWIDAFAFEQCAAHPEQRDAALELYRGEFLGADGDAAWTIPTRERLRSRFVQLIEASASAHEAKHAWDEAANLYQRGIDADPLFERFHQGLMRCYVNAERNAEALSVYRRLRQTLSVSLGVRPSAYTEEMYRSVYKNQG